MTTPIKMPQLSDTMTEGVVVSWEKSIGDTIKRGDIVATVETDKAIMDVEVFSKGFLSGPLAPEGEVLPVGAVMGHVVKTAEEVVQGEFVAEAPPADPGHSVAGDEETVVTDHGGPRPPARAPIGAPRGGPPAARPAHGATPYARALAGAYGVDLSGVRGSGPSGAVLAADVEASRGAASAGAGFGVLGIEDADLATPGVGRAMTGIEAATARSMQAGWTMPTFRVSVGIRLASLKRAAKGAKVGLTVAIARACALAMGKHAKMNAAWQPGGLILERSNVDVGIAVAADGGLVVPVLRDAESASLADLTTSWKDLVSRARKRRLKPEEWAHPTFMVSNMGMLGVDWFDAIPTPGTSAIVAISRPDAEGAAPFTVTADHRVNNGADVAMWLQTLKGLIEAPDAWLAPAGPAIPPGDWDYDVVVVGGGPGGQDCARDLAQNGMKVAMVNDAPLPGGECLWRGCIPSKAWRGAADKLKDRADDARLGVFGTTSGTLDWASLEDERRRILEARGEMAAKADKGMKIAAIQGFGSFVDEHTLAIHTGGNSDERHRRLAPGLEDAPRTVTFGCAVVATGAPPFVPPIPGARERIGLDGGVHTSDTIWWLPAAPKRVAVVGGGAIGCEMAQMFHDFGAEVVLLEMQERLLAEVEPEVARELAAVLDAQERMRVLTSVAVSGVSGTPGAMTVTWQAGGDHKGGAEASADCDLVLVATGKRPVLEGLGLGNAGIASDRGVIVADARCRTSVPHIFAVGDVIGGLMLAHTAGEQGRVAAATILGEDRTYDQAVDTGVIFTRPQAAFAGLSKAQAEDAGLEVSEIKVPLKLDAQAMIHGEEHGLVKLVAENRSRRIVGVHLLADHADTLVSGAALMVSAGLTLDQVGSTIFPHPTTTELFGDLARRLDARLTRSAKRAAARAAKR